MNFLIVVIVTLLISACSTKTVLTPKESESESFLKNVQNEVKENFDRVDQNGDSRISKGELGRETSKLFSKVDLDSNKKLDSKELSRFSSKSVSSWDVNGDQSVSENEFSDVLNRWLSPLVDADLNKVFSFFKMSKPDQLRLSVYKCPEWIELPGVRKQGIDLIAKSDGELETIYNQSSRDQKKFKSLKNYIRAENNSWNLPEGFTLAEITEPGKLERREQIKFKLYQSSLAKRVEKAVFLKAYPYLMSCNYRGEGFSIQLDRPIESSFCQMNSGFRKVEKMNRPGLYTSVESCEGERPETCRLSCQESLF